jgi:hypothetical protein
VPTQQLPGPLDGVADVEQPADQRLRPSVERCCAYRMLWSYDSTRPASLPANAGHYEFNLVRAVRRPAGPSWANLALVSY